LETLATAGLVHDIGALHIEASQLDQSEQLRSEHWRQIHTHSQIGHLILEEFNEYTPHISRAVLEHHERLDGSGYPYGLKGSEISRAGRILSFVDFAVGSSQKLGMNHMFTIVKIHPPAFDREVVQVLAGIVRNFDEVLDPSTPRIEIGVLRNLMATVSETLSSAPMELPATVLAPSPQLKKMVELLLQTAQTLTLMVHRIGFDLNDVESSIGRVEGDPVLQTELEILLHEIHFRLRGLVLELHRHSDADESSLEGFDALHSWINGTEAKVNQMRELFPGPLEATKAA